MRQRQEVQGLPRQAGLKQNGASRLRFFILAAHAGYNDFLGLEGEKMNARYKSEISSYLARVETLFSEVEKWANAGHLNTLRAAVKITEDSLGTYDAPMLSITNPEGKKIAELRPIGTRILGANGRVDLLGNFDKAILTDLNEGGPTLSSTVTHGSHTQTHSSKFYRGIEEAGWYWIDRSVVPKGHQLNQGLFLDLLSKLSDYEQP
jgi:hypothetical protein